MNTVSNEEMYYLAVVDNIFSDTDSDYSSGSDPDYFPETDSDSAYENTDAYDENTNE